MTWPYVLFVVVWILIGLYFKVRKPKTNKIKTKNIKKENPILVYNFIGNEILCQTIPILLYFVYGLSSVPFLAGALMSYLAIILHVSDATGKPIETIFNKLEFSEENLKNNLFMRITVILIIVFIIFAIAMLIIQRFFTK